MTDTHKIIMAKNLQRLMDSAGVDRYKLCDDLGFKYSTVCEWLSANKYPRMDKIEMLANYFNVKKSEIIEESAQPRAYIINPGTSEPYDDKPTFPPKRGRIRGGLKAAKIITKNAPDKAGDEPIAIKATRKEWIEIMSRMSDENRQKLQDYAELLLLKQDQGGQED